MVLSGLLGTLAGSIGAFTFLFGDLLADVCKAAMRRYNLSSFQSGTVVSSSLLGALAGSAGAFAFGDKLGRRGELLLASVLYGMMLETADVSSVSPVCQMRRSFVLVNKLGLCNALAVSNNARRRNRLLPASVTYGHPCQTVSAVRNKKRQTAGMPSSPRDSFC